MRERRQMNVVRIQQPTSPLGLGQHQDARIDDVERTTRTPIYLLSAETDVERTVALEQKIRTIIPNLIRIKNLEGIVPGQAKGLIYILFVAPAEGDGYIDKLINIATKYRDRVFFILISNEISTVDYKRLVRSGGADWVSAAAPQEIIEIIARQPANEEARGAESAGPVVVSFVPSAGGVGNSTLAIEVAIQLKKKKGSRDRRVCLVDLDLQMSHVCDYMDMKPHLQIQEIAADPDRLDSQLFDMFVSRHSSGVDVFAAPRSKFNPCDLDIAVLDTVFEMIAKRYDLILIDLPATWFPWTRQIIQASDGIIVTGINTVPGLGQVSETLAALRNAPGPAADAVVVALNRCDYGLLGRISRRQHVDLVLGREKVFFVRDDPVALESINTGTPIGVSSPQRKIIKDIGLIAALCTGLKSSRVAVRK